jgi:CheY-like chemotaxis protein
MGNEARVMTTKKALIVDDSKLAQFLLKKMLGRHELEVDTIDSAEEALGYLSHKKPDVGPYHARYEWFTSAKSHQGQPQYRHNSRYDVYLSK